jgi:ammonia channel protein AmtB
MGCIGWSYILGEKKIQKKVNPARITYVLLGTGLLWFGWFGFNAGSALGSKWFSASMEPLAANGWESARRCFR